MKVLGTVMACSVRFQLAVRHAKRWRNIGYTTLKQLLEDNIELSSATSSVNIRTLMEVDSAFLGAPEAGLGFPEAAGSGGGDGNGTGLGLGGGGGRISHSSSIAVAFEKDPEVDVEATEVKEVEVEVIV